MVVERSTRGWTGAVAEAPDFGDRAIHAAATGVGGLDGLARDVAVVGVVVGWWRVGAGAFVEFDVEVEVVVFDELLQSEGEGGVVGREVDGAVAGIDEQGGGVFDFDGLDDDVAFDFRF